jgi:hypothetical protein
MPGENVWLSTGTTSSSAIGKFGIECVENCPPTNLRTVTVTKSANGPGGTGSVSSKPKGIKCGTTCSEAVARLYKEQEIVLTAKPTLTSAFVKWENAKEGGACDGSTNPVCTVPKGNKEDVSLEAIYSGTAKTIAPTETLTLSKGESEESFGKGTVKASGLVCEADCSSTDVLYQGPVTEPKVKPGKTVILKQAPAFGSKFVGWTGCDTETEAGECIVEMDEDHTVSAEYEAKPNKTLTVNKAYSSGNGTVSSKPKGIKCATTCTQAVAQMPEGAAIELLAKPALETTFVEWVGGDCDKSASPTCVVTMNADETTKAVFSKAGKAFLGGSEPTLTLTKEGVGAKAGEGGYGTVKAAGLVCEVLCTSTSVLYQGPLTEPKPKAGKTVVLKQAPAFGSKFVGWSGCDSVTEAGECVVEMDESHAVTATFEELK